MKVKFMILDEEFKKELISLQKETYLNAAVDTLDALRKSFEYSPKDSFLKDEIFTIIENLKTLMRTTNKN